ncbi:hypothetical protein VSU19_22665 [Verrucomicrobiales bacterium BCK34]|nr:hypothetical protein [Verrucomicrobiales bacterium BCK34]
MKTAFLLSLALFTLAGCTTNTPDSGSEGYYSTEPVRPVDRAVNLQDQLGASTRSLY